MANAGNPPKTYVITNRQSTDDGGYGADPTSSGSLTFLEAAGMYTTDPTAFTEVPQDKFLADLLADLKSRRPAPAADGSQGRAKAALYIHGYNNSHEEALRELAELGNGLANHQYDGLLILYSWPSAGTVTGYIHDERVAMDSLGAMYNIMQIVRDLQRPMPDCFIELSLLAHSMGNFVLEEGVAYFHDHEGNPGSDLYFAQTLMFAADVGNDAFDPGKEGTGVAAFSYRVTAYYSYADEVLNLSQSVKHAGQRRLGRSGPADYRRINVARDNIVGVDCTEVNNNVVSTHWDYRTLPVILDDFAKTLAGIDRSLVPRRQEIPDTNRRGYKIV